MTNPKRPFTAIFNELKLALEAARSSEEIINLGLGNPGTVPDNAIVAAATVETGEPVSYGSGSGALETRVAMARFLTQARQAPYDFDAQYSQIAITGGVTQSMEAYLTALANKRAVKKKSGNVVYSPLRVAIPTPAYAWYFNIIDKIPSAEAIKIDTAKTDWKLNANTLAKILAQDNAPDVLLLNYPCNPTGQNLSEDEWKAIGEVLKAHVKTHPNFRIILDNAYTDLQFGAPTSLLDAAPELKAHVIEFNSVAKFHGYAGRIGPGFAASQSTDDIAMLRKQLATILGIGPDNERLLREAFKPERFTMKQMEPIISRFRRRCRFVANYINEQFTKDKGTNHQIALTPEGGMFVFADFKDWLGVKIDPPKEAWSLKQKMGELVPDDKDYFDKELFRNSKINDDKDLCVYLALKAHVIALPGRDFGSDPKDGMVRLALGDIGKMTTYSQTDDHYFKAYLPKDNLQGKPLDDLRKLKEAMDKINDALKELEKLKRGQVRA